MRVSFFSFIVFFIFPMLALADISASQTEGCAPLAGVVFSNSYSNATNINWDLGNGASSSSPSPVNSYSEPGVYTVVFTATVNGSPVSESLTITVFENPVADFTIGPENGTCLGSATQFTDNSSAATGSSLVNWQWNFGDGSPSASGQNQSHTYGAAGTYDVTLVVTDNNGCTASATLFDEAIVSTPPTTSFSTSPNPPVACEAPLLVSFINSSSTNAPNGGGLTYAWNFGNGSTSTQENPPPVNYTTEGTFVVTLVATDIAGCESTASTVVSLQEPSAEISVVNAENGVSCGDIELEIEGTPGGIFNYGDGTTGTSLEHTYTQEGEFTITYNISVSGCSASASTSIIIEMPSAEIVSDPGFACTKPAPFSYSLESDYDIESYNWTFDDGTTSTASNPNTLLDYEGPNEYAINGLITFMTSVEFTTANGCTGTATVLDSISLPNALIYQDQNQGCAPLNVDFTDNSGHYYGGEIVEWEWHFGDGTIETNNTSTDPSHTYANAGEYEAFLVITTDAGCIDTSFFQDIVVGEELNPSFTLSATSVCPGEPFSIINTSSDLDLIDAYAYSGDMNTFGACLDEASPTFVFDDVAGQETITQFVEYNGCVSESTQEITVNGPVAKISYGCNCDTPFDYTFEAEVYDADSWTWDFGDGTVVPNSTSSFISHTYASTGDYTAVITATNGSSGCGDFIDSVHVKVRDLIPALEIPARSCFGEEVTLNASNSIDVGANDGCERNYLWEFDDGSRPYKTLGSFTNHTFEMNGVNTVTLSVKDDNECVRTTTATIKVFDVEAAYDADTLYGCPPLEVNFSDLSTGDTTIVAWTWNFGDGSVESSDQNPNHIFDNPVFGPGNTPLPNQITLEVTDILGCTSTINNLVIQQLGPNPNFGPSSPTNICVGDDVSFVPSGSNTTYHTYEWDYGNGDSSEGPVGSSTFELSGQYEITLVVTDTVGCSRELTQTLVNVQDYPVAIIDPSFNVGDVLCYPTIIDYVDVSINPFPSSRTWLLEGNPPTSNPATSTTYTLPGEYDVSLSVTSTHGCMHDTSLTVVIEGPLGEIVLDPEAICPGGDISLSLADTADLAFWSFTLGDGNSVSNQLPVDYTYADDFIPGSGFTNIVLVMHSPDSACSAGRQVELTIEEVIADFALNQDINVEDSIHCFGIPDSFFNTSSANATSFDWTVESNGNTYTTENVQNIDLPVGTSVIELIVESDLGCRDTLYRTMEIFPLPEPTITPGTSICQGEDYVLMADGGETYSWTPVIGLDDPTSNVVVATPEFTTTYTVLVTDTNNCSESISSQLFVYLPPPSVSEDTTLYIGDYDNAGFYLGEGYTYQWSPNIYLGCDTCANTWFRPLEDITYTLTISDTLGCFSIDSYFAYSIIEVESVSLPDAFTPNGDGINDVIFVKGWGIEEIHSFQIYNRWGELVFETNDINEGWDGTYKGELQNSDSYAYVVVAKNFISEQPETHKGFIDLIR